MDLKTMKNISTTIKKILSSEPWVNFHPLGINTGWCYDFAIDVLKHCADGKLVAVENESHYVVLYNQKYYDSETINGVDCIADIPYVKRANVNPVQS